MAKDKKRIIANDGKSAVKGKGSGEKPPPGTKPGSKKSKKLK